MKNLIILMALSFSFVGTTQTTINWMSMTEAVAAQEKAPKKIMVDVYTSWCGPCKLLDKNTFQNEDVAAYVNENFYAVKFNAEGSESFDFKDKTYGNPNFKKGKKGRNSQHQFAAYLRVSAYPTIVFMDEKSDIIAPLVGYKTPKDLEIYLKMFAKDDHTAVDSKEKWIEYQENFKYAFKSE